MTLAHRVLAIATALACGSPLAGVVLVPNEAVAQSSPAKLQSEDRTRKAWQDRYRNAIDRERAARIELEAAQAAYNRGRHRQKLRGDKRVRALERIRLAEQELAEATRDLERVPDEARRAGVPPGWLRDVEG